MDNNYFMPFFWGGYLILYIFLAYVMAKIAMKLGFTFKKGFILSLIPIANLYLIIKMAGKEWWWLLLMLIPLVNFILVIVLWVNILRRLRKPAWWVILILLPPISLVIFLILAFGKSEPALQQ